jgi:Restriction endonuclease
VTRPQVAGVKGEQVAEWCLERRGWKVTGRQVAAGGGHRCDFSATQPQVGDEEWLVEVKVWGAEPSGRDTVKKAIADAYDLAQAGESRPFLLVLSHRLTGLLGEMITRARRAGVINDVLVIGASDYQPPNGSPR